MITGVDLVKIERVINVRPHVVVTLDMMIKALSSTLELVTGQTTDETHGLLVLLRTELQGHAHTSHTPHNPPTHSLVSQLGESVDDDPKDDVETDGCHDDEE